MCESPRLNKSEMARLIIGWPKFPILDKISNIDLETLRIRIIGRQTKLRPRHAFRESNIIKGTIGPGARLVLFSTPVALTVSFNDWAISCPYADFFFLQCEGSQDSTNAVPTLYSRCTNVVPALYQRWYHLGLPKISLKSPTKAHI